MPPSLDKNERQPDWVFRTFRDHPNDLANKSPTEKRLASSLFLNKELSVDDGALCTLAEVEARNAGKGIAAVRKSDLLALGLRLDPDPVSENAAHCLVIGIDQKQAKLISRKADIAVGIAGLNIVPGH